MSILRRIRGLLGLAAIGAIAWVPLGMAVVIIQATVSGDRLPTWSMFPQAAIRFAAGGAACGFLFGLILLVMDRRRNFGGLTFGRTALWGALGGVAIPVALVASGNGAANEMLSIGSLAIFGVVGAVMSAGTLALARKAPSLSDPATNNLDALASAPQVTELPQASHDD